MNENYNPTSGGPNPHRKQGWSDFLENLKHQRDKVGWILGVITTVFATGFFSGKFYESLMNKFTISEMKTNHAKELQDVKTDFILREVGKLSDEQKKSENYIINNIDTLDNEE